MSPVSGQVFSIERYAIHDGPGIRTTVFLKGCPLKCLWCHNPEGMETAPQLAYYAWKCLHCGLCTETCPLEATPRKMLLGLKRMVVDHWRTT